MKTVRILLVSSTRPARAWRIARRFSDEMPGVEVCGIAQHPWRKLPWVQQLIATGDLDALDGRGRLRLQASRWVRNLWRKLLDWGIWCAHGCPSVLPVNAKFTDRDLAARCQENGWPFMRVEHLGGTKVAEFARRQRADLIVVLGQPLLSRELLAVPQLGVVRINVRGGPDPDVSLLRDGVELRVEHFSPGCGSACDLASAGLPAQPHDGLLGITLKNDLIADDLLFQAAKALEQGCTTRASKEIGDWIRRILSPCLDQFSSPPAQSLALGTKLHPRHRSTAKLFAHSLLGLPWVVCRNWYRRLRGRYPVLILAHHLVSDRPHSMGISTEDFWRRVRFLQRHYRIVSLSEARDLLRSGRVGTPALVLTFDDGYGDNFITLRAVTEETGASVTTFVATQPVEAQLEFDHDLAAGTKGFFPLTWNQIQELSRNGVEFGGHTRTHFDCGSRDRARLHTEITGCKRDLENHLGRPCNSFAFPYGKSENISPEALQIAASTYSSFFSSYGGENLAREGHLDQHLLRKGFYSDPWELELELQSVFSLAESGKEKLERVLGSLYPKNLGSRRARRWPWTLLHACLLLLAVLPPFRRLLNEISQDL
jgi:peptidoglycan/xylan/chitin deacetylase (PgdA/CDA1 family)